MHERTDNSSGLALAPWKWLLLPLMVAMTCMAYLWAGDGKNFASPATARIIFWHVPMAILSMLWFFVSAWFAGRYLLKGETFDDTRAAIAAEVGLVLTVLATVTGAVFSKMQWAGGLGSAWYEGYWQWDPKQTAIAIVIVIFSAYFALRMSVEDPRTRARLSGVYAILGAAAVPFLYYTLPNLPIFKDVSLHPNDVVKAGGMDVPYRWTFNLSILAHLGVSLWAYQLKVRLGTLEERALAAEPAAETRTTARRTQGPGTEGVA
jgi:heme exporter protein C